MLYRILIFVPPSDSAGLLNLCLSTLAKMIEFYEEKIPIIQEFQQSIGYWLGCLILEHKRAEIGKKFLQTFCNKAKQSF